MLMRPNEVCQLRADDIRQKRRVRAHPELQEVGFIYLVVTRGSLSKGAWLILIQAQQV